MTTDAPQIDWEAELGALLADLAAAQNELLELLAEKRELMAAGDVDGMIALEPREEQLCQRLESCQLRRAEILQSAAQHGLPDDSLRVLADQLPPAKRGSLHKQFKESSSRTRLLQHHCLANWVAAQRSLLHVAQLLQILATGGRLQPTYGDGESVHARGALVDREV